MLNKVELLLLVQASTCCRRQALQKTWNVFKMFVESRRFAQKLEKAHYLQLFRKTGTVACAVTEAPGHYALKNS